MTANVKSETFRLNEGNDMSKAQCLNGSQWRHTVLCCLILLFGVTGDTAYAQQGVAVPDDTAHGIKLYNQGDTKGAVTVLRNAVKRNRNDADAWYYLGSALVRDDDLKGARKAFQRASKLRPEHAPSHIGLAYVLLIVNKLEDASFEVLRALALDARNAEAHYVMGRIYMRKDDPELALEEAETATKLDPDYAPAFLLKSRAIMSVYVKESYIKVGKNITVAPLGPEELKAREVTRVTRFNDAAESLERYLQLSKNAVGIDMWREQLASLRLYVETQEKDDVDPQVRAPFDVDKKAQIISKPSPDYPIQERDAGITGTVTLFLTFSFDGTIKDILLIHAPTDRLAAAAVQAARKIKFTPAIKNGMPVSQYIRIEYNFNIY